MLRLSLRAVTSQHLIINTTTNSAHRNHNPRSGNITIVRIYPKSPGERFVRLLAHVHKQTGKRCVVLVDEYDKPLLDVLDTERKVKLDDEELLMEDYNRETLKGFYSVF